MKYCKQQTGAANVRLQKMFFLIFFPTSFTSSYLVASKGAFYFTAKSKISFNDFCLSGKRVDIFANKMYSHDRRAINQIKIVLFWLLIIKQCAIVWLY